MEICKGNPGKVNRERSGSGQMEHEMMEIEDTERRSGNNEGINDAP